MFRRMIAGALLVVGAGFMAGANAQITSLSSFDPAQCSVQNPAGCLNGVSSAVTSLDALRVFLARPTNQEAEGGVHERRAALRPLLVASGGAVAGLGATSSGWGVWASGQRARFEGTVPFAPYQADLDTLTVGLDRLFASRFLLGAALLGERLDTRTRYNAGGQDGDGTTLTAYASYLVNDAVSVDATVGRGWLQTDQFRLDPQSLIGVPSNLRASYDSDRLLWSLTLNASRQFGALGVGARLGYLHAREKQDGYVETGGPSARTIRARTVSLGQAFAGVDASYGLHRDWQLHGAAMYRRDTSRDDGRSGGGLPNFVGVVQPADRDELEWIVGMRYYGGRRFTLNLEYLHTSGRDFFRNEALTLTARYDF